MNFEKTLDIFQIGNYSIGDEINYYVEAYDGSLNKNYYKNDNSSNYYKITIVSETDPETEITSMGSFYHFFIYTLFIAVVLISYKNKFQKKK